MHAEVEANAVLPTALDLSGVWHEVPENAPAGPFRRPPPCYEGLGWVALEQSGERVTMLRRFAEPAQGVRLAVDIEQLELAAGVRRGDAVELDGELVRTSRPMYEPGPTTRKVLARPHWTLTLDRGSGHLVGTRDGVAVRLAPLVLVPPPGDALPNRCGAPPP